MTAPKSTRRRLAPKTILANFSRYLYARRGLGESTVNNYLSTMRRLFPVLGTHPTARAAEQHIAEMRKAGLSQSHQVNTSIALERYGDFIHVSIRLARPRAPYSLVRGTLSEAEMARFIGATRTRGSGLLAIKEQLGHVFVSTTMRYIHSMPARLQEEYRLHAPSYL